MKKNGFSLLELMIATSMTVVVVLLAFIAVQSSTKSMAVATAQDAVQGNIRDALAEMTRELELASTTTLEPDLFALRVETTGGTPTIIFQTPLDTSGLSWSTPITYQYINEDRNMNNRLDQGEDTNGDGVLTRCIMREQDDEERPVGGANDLRTATFVLDATGKVLTISLTAAKEMGPSEGTRWTKAEVSSRIRILN